MSLTLSHVVVDCHSPQVVAAFWSAALERPIDEGGSEFFVAISGNPTWFFIQVPEAKAVKNRVHIDFSTTDRAGEIARLIDLGATKVSEHDEWGAQWVVVADPEGNEFCVQ